MKHTKKVNPVNHSIPASLLSGWIAGCIVTAIITFMMTCLIAGEFITETYISPMSSISMALSAFVASYITVKRAGKYILLTSFASGVIYYMTLVICNTLIFRGSYIGLGVGALIILTSTIIMSIILLRKTAKKAVHYQGSPRR